MDQLKNPLNSSIHFIQNIDVVKILLGTLIFGLIFMSGSILISIISISSYSLYLALSEQSHLKSIVLIESTFILFYYLFIEPTESLGCFGGYIHFEKNIYYFILFLLRTIIISNLFEIKLKRHTILFLAVLIVSVKVHFFPQFTSSDYPEYNFENEIYYDYNQPYEEEVKPSLKLEGQYFAELEYWKDTIRDFETIIIDIHSDSIIFDSKNINNKAFVRSKIKHKFDDDYSFYLLQDGISIPTMINFHEGSDFAEIQLFNVMGYNKINTITLKSKIPSKYQHKLF